ncbi:hydroxyethylthiazole kinase [Thermococcus barophilus]|uniref:Hydroxyethylthiazole kinase n=1 Tax=Thermococcus barophilus (strain DSM 11836 / MP) TaxID=391623 RepID=F0LJU6_THEBM|nr:hydroxyethylthiazole kinase [Thermococcus barophilus]ADT83483.1 hydroxyethylthiazole kinase [Thermococcus barophilus MP]
MEWIAKALERVRKRKPLVQNITNFVVMNTTANALLALGASPVMAHARDELEDMLRIADSLVVNIGTLDEHWIPSMEKAVKIASELKKPTVLDPVGAGATKLRTETALRLLEIGDITILRGNFGEIAALLGEHGRTRGVDSATYEEDKAKELALTAAREFNTVVAVTGPVDYVSDGKGVYAVYNGNEMLGRVTGTGCMVTAITGAFAAVEEPLKAAVSALAIFGIAAEKACEEAKYPGSFHVKLYDWLYRIDEELIIERAKVRKVEP